MTDDMTVAQRSYTMSRIRSSGNEATELRFLKLLRSLGITGWRRKVRLAGRPDLVFRKERVVVFLDGCFWHGCPRCALRSKSNLRYWDVKIPGNVARDKRVNAELRAKGWQVLRIWQHEIKKRPLHAARKLVLRLGRESG
jgi:DNA mismatch endonuclease (patch repair protein)